MPISNRAAREGSVQARGAAFAIKDLSDTGEEQKEHGVTGAGWSKIRSALARWQALRVIQKVTKAFKSTIHESSEAERERRKHFEADNGYSYEYCIVFPKEGIYERKNSFQRSASFLTDSFLKMTQSLSSTLYGERSADYEEAASMTTGQVRDFTHSPQSYEHLPPNNNRTWQ